MRRLGVVVVVGIFVFAGSAARAERSEEQRAGAGRPVHGAAPEQPVAPPPPSASLLEARQAPPVMLGQARPLAEAAGSAYWSLAAGVYLSGAADWRTTRAFRRAGVEEANPLVGPVSDSRWGLAALKLGGASLVNYAAHDLRRDGRRWWWLPQAVWIVLNSAVSAHNARAAE